MRPEIAGDTVTSWRRDGESWARSVFSGVRAEWSRGSDAAQVGPEPSRDLKVYFFRDPGLSDGDYLVLGAVGGSEPPEGALRVARVNRWTLRYRHHHTEVTAR